MNLEIYHCSLSGFEYFLVKVILFGYNPDKANSVIASCYFTGQMIAHLTNLKNVIIHDRNNQYYFHKLSETLRLRTLAFEDKSRVLIRIICAQYMIHVLS